MNEITVPFDNTVMEIIEGLSDKYGVEKSFVVRLLVLTGLKDVYSKQFVNLIEHGSQEKLK